MQEQKEIDIVELYQKILVFIFRKKWIFLLFVVLGIAVGYALYLKKSNEITTNFLAESQDVSKELIFSIADKIAFELENQDYQQLSTELEINTEVLTQIQSLGLDTSGSILNISVVSTTKDVLLPFTKAMVNYINKQPYIVNKLNTQKEQTLLFIEAIEKEIAHIEQMQQRFLEESKSQVTINQVNGTHSEKIRLLKLKQEQEAILKQTEAVSIINRDNNTVRNENSLLKYLAISVIIALITACFFFFCQYSFNLVKKS